MTSRDSGKSSEQQSTEGELATSGHILSGFENGCFVLQFMGDVRLVWSVALERYCESIFLQQRVERFFVDLTQSSNLDSTTLGVLAKLAMLCKKKLGFEAELSFDHADIERLVMSMGFATVFNILPTDSKPPIDAERMRRLCSTDCSEDEVKKSVLEAHRTLAGMSSENYNKFKDLIDSLEK